MNKDNLGYLGVSQKIFVTFRNCIPLFCLYHWEHHDEACNFAGPFKWFSPKSSTRDYRPE